MSNDMRKWAVDLYDGDTYLTTVIIDHPANRLERDAYYREVFTLTSIDGDQRRARAQLDKRERE